MECPDIYKICKEWARPLIYSEDNITVEDLEDIAGLELYYQIWLTLSV